MKVILTEKIHKLGNIGDAVEVATGFARNFLLPKGKAMRWSRDNIALFESQKAQIVAKHEAARKTAESKVDAVKNAKLYMIRQAGDTGHLYGSVSSRDVARMLGEIAKVNIESAQVLMGSPIKTIGAFETKVALHPDVIVPVKIFVAQTQDEIEALVAGKVLTFGVKKVEEETESAPDEKPAETAPVGADESRRSEAKAEDVPPEEVAQPAEKPKKTVKKTAKKVEE